MSSSSSLVDAFLLVDQPRQRLGHWSRALDKLDSDQAPPLARVTAYYDPSTDQALIGLRYDEIALGPEKLAYVVEVALLAELGMIQPHELSEGDRKRFLSDRLARCVVTVENQRGVVGALTELVRQLKENKGTVKTFAGALPPPPPGAAFRSPLLPRTVTPELPLAVHVKSTRDDLPTGDAMRDVHGAETQPKKIGAMTRASSPRAQSEPSISDALPPGIIYARYLRGGRWVPLRIGALSLKGAALMSGALPRINDNVDVALAYGAHRALVRGSVGKVSSDVEARTSGAATFSVDFDLDDASRRQLTSLLSAARAAQVTIKPPPPRANRRYPVEWTVALNTTRVGSVRATALDVSTDGMFVRPLIALEMGTTITFSSLLEDMGPPISGRAKVVRHVAEADASKQGLSTGFGLQIIDMSGADKDRWTAFLNRIEKRVDRRILVGATPARLAELQAALVSVGYNVMGGTDPGALVQLARQGRPFDVVVLDAGWLAPGASASWIETLFSARNVPCLTLHGDSRRARTAVDKLLTISS